MDLSELRLAAIDRNVVEGLTHSFYRYPARFSPVFAATAIRSFTKPGDLVLDPYVGGGTTVVESLANGRRVIGSDLNSLAIFVTKVKTTLLTAQETRTVGRWAKKVESLMTFRYPRESIEHLLDDSRTTNLSLPQARPLKKGIAIALDKLAGLPSVAAQDFARCVILRTSQWALDNRKRKTSLGEFRARLVENCHEMLASLEELGQAILPKRNPDNYRTLINGNAELLHEAAIFRSSGRLADLVLASPPYPGIHMLYHRWQVDGRRESPAPYWITDCNDGQGESYYTFGGRRRCNLDRYFEESLLTLQSIRRCVRRGGYFVQMLAFSSPRSHLARYLENMRAARFREFDISSGPTKRVWRDVPNRKWHANFKGKTGASKEVLLIHRAI